MSGGRIRSIKPEILEDAATACLSDIAFRVFVGSIVLCDDYGRFRAEPGWLRGQIYWAHSVDPEAFAAAIVELERKLIRTYYVNGQRYAEVVNWAKHQKVDKPGKPKIPAPSEDSRESRESVANVSRECRESLAPDLGSGIREMEMDLGPPVVPPSGGPTTGVSEVLFAVEPIEPESGARKRGTRLPKDWTPSAEAQTWAKAQGVADPCGTVLEEFRDYWSAVPGAKGVKLDWEATFRNQIRRVAALPGRRIAPVQSMAGACFKIPEGF